MKAECEICGDPGIYVGYAGILCNKHRTAGKIPKKVGVKDPKVFPIGASLTVQGRYEPDGSYSGFALPKQLPNGYVTWRQFLSKHGKKSTNPDAYRALKFDGKAETFMGDRIVKADSEWPLKQRSRK